MIQYIVFYPDGDSIDATTGKRTSNAELAAVLIHGLKRGQSAAVPANWRVQTVDLSPSDPLPEKEIDPLNPENLSPQEISDRLNKGFAPL